MLLDFINRMIHVYLLNLVDEGAPGVVASPFATMAGLGMGMGPTPLTAIGATTLGGMAN